MSKPIQVSLVGNPNTGKTSLFNQLTGLNQKVGNYPGVTVDKKQGVCKLPNGKSAVFTDLPGTYSINPTSLDESIVLKTLLNPNEQEKPDVVLVVVDVENLKRNLLLFTQIQDLKIPTILAVNMADQMDKKGISLDLKKLEEKLHTKAVLISARNNQGIDELKEVLSNFESLESYSLFTEISSKIDADYFSKLDKVDENNSLYSIWLSLTQQRFLSNYDNDTKERLSNFNHNISQQKKYQHKETIYRYQNINNILKETYTIDKNKAIDIRSKLDRIFTHKIFGYVFFFILLFVMFQSIFDWASIPMDFIDATFGNLAEYVKTQLPPGKFTDLLADGIIAGIGGVVIFIPQIIILFLFIAILEETGYMSRVVFLMDKIMRRFGLSGKGVIPLISGTACAIPAIMATRTITNNKERLITILVTPFTTCSARLPVYTILIALIIPNQKILGVFSLQGLTLLGLYALGFGVAVLSAYILHKTLGVTNKSLFVIEMPDYKVPSFKNVFFEVYEKTKAFIIGAGRIILSISIILWFLASHGPKSFQTAEKDVISNVANQQLSEEEIQQKIASAKLEKSYIGIAGKTLEPLVKPLGYDWKIGIGLISSFAAREVFVGTLATIYSIEGVEDEGTIKETMAKEINQDTGKKRFNFATGMSLLIFYAFSMQCMATLAIVKRETKSWKWPLLQLFGMGFFSYITALLTFQFLN